MIFCHFCERFMVLCTLCNCCLWDILWLAVWSTHTKKLFFHMEHMPTGKQARCTLTHAHTCSHMLTHAHTMVQTPLKHTHWALCSRFYFSHGHLHLQFISVERNTAGASGTQTMPWQWLCQTHTRTHTQSIHPAGRWTSFNDTFQVHYTV